MKLVLVTTHPIHYQIPWFQQLSECADIDLVVLYGVIPSESQQGLDFGIDVKWNIPMFEGYQWAELDTVVPNPDLSKFSGCDTPGILEKMRSLNPDVLIITGWHSKMLFQAISAGRKLKLPIIVRGESNSLRSRSILKKIFHRWLLSRFDRFLAIGKSNRQFYKQYGIQDSRIFDAPYFVDNNRFVGALRGGGEAIASVRKKFGVDPNTFCFLYSGKLIEKKHVSHLLEAFHITYANNKNTRLLIVGDGEQRMKLEKFCNDHELPVVFAGFVNQKEIPLLYGACNSLVLCSDYGETWGLVVNEAMACGIPAIVSDQVGCSKDLIISGETGYVYPFGQIGLLADNMVAMASDLEGTREMGMKAQKFITQKYTVSNTVDATLDAIQSLGNK